MVLSTWHQCTYHKFTQRLLIDIIGASNCLVGRTITFIGTWDNETARHHNSVKDYDTIYFDIQEG